MTGIHVSNGDQNALCCNAVEDTYYGVAFAGYCEETKLRHTDFMGNSMGLFCNPNTRIGEQSAAGNTWDESLIWQAIHQSTVEADINQSRFFAAPGAATWPQNVSVAATGANWFTSGGVAPLCTEDMDNCQRPVLNRLAMSTGYTQKILQDRFYYGDYAETSDWEAKRSFYRSQKATSPADRSAWSSQSRSFFGQQTQNKSALYKLTTIAQSLEEYLVADPQITTVVGKMNQLDDQIFSLDQTIEEGEPLPATYLSTRADLLERQNVAFTDFTLYLKQKKSEHTALIGQLKQENATVSTPVEAATAMRAVNSWYFETMAEGLESLPLTIEASLREMAERCPQRFGSAVGRAQSILVHYDKPFTVSEECQKDEKSGFKTPVVTSPEEPGFLNEALTVANVRIFPNPTSGILTVQLPPNVDLLNWNAELIDLKGQVLASQTSQGRRVAFNVAKFSPGVYLIRVQSSQGSVSKRVIVQ